MPCLVAESATRVPHPPEPNTTAMLRPHGSQFGSWNLLFTSRPGTQTTFSSSEADDFIENSVSEVGKTSWAR